MMKISALLTTAVLAVSGTAAADSYHHHRPQPHEARIVMPFEGGGAGIADWQSTAYDRDRPELGKQLALATSIDTRQYPSGTVWTLRLVTRYVHAQTGTCWRLYDLTIQQPVEGSQVCHSAAQAAQWVWLTDEVPVHLPAACHLYEVQGRGIGGDMREQTLIARWHE